MTEREQELLDAWRSGRINWRDYSLARDEILAERREQEVLKRRRTIALLVVAALCVVFPAIPGALIFLGILWFVPVVLVAVVGGVLGLIAVAR